MASFPELDVRTLGGFAARCDGEEITALESQRVRALFVYLLLEGRRDRAETARFLWSLEDPAIARRNLRQALYNLRSSLEPCEMEIRADRSIVEVSDASLCRLDVHDFRRAVVEVRRAEGEDARRTALERAAAIYGGDFLAGTWFDSPVFEDWLVETQEELRTSALEILRDLVRDCEGRRDHQTGIEHARRWLELDPLAEQAHRALMRMYDWSGRRGQALAQYETCRHRLEVELSTEPLPETTLLYRELLGQQLREVGLETQPRPVAPILPLVGRRGAYSRLFQIWEQVARGRGATTVLTGDPGSGKTRLLKAFTHDAASGREAVVLQGRCYRSAIRTPFQVFADLGRSLRETAPEIWGELVDRHPDLAVILPEVSQELDGIEGLLEGWVAAFEIIHRRSGAPVIALVDDVQSADPASRRLLDLLVPRTRKLPVWILATWTHRGGLPREGIGEDAIVVELERLRPADLRDLARQIVVDPIEAAKLGTFLVRRTGGAPLAVAEWVNLLGDEGHLHPTQDGWALSGDPEDLGRCDADELVERRVSALPSSTRRLLTLAAVIGPIFDAGFLAFAANEDLRVVERGLEILMKRWMIRPMSRVWFESIGARELEGFARGPTGSFEMVHSRFRRKVLRQLHPSRRRILHEDVLVALRSRRDCGPETLARHAIAAGAWAEAEGYLCEAVARAERLGASDVAGDHRRLLDRLRREARNLIGAGADGGGVGNR